MSLYQLRAHRSIMGFHQLLDNGEAYPSPAVLPGTGFFTAIETLEHLIDLVCGDSDALVSHCNDHSFTGCGYIDGDLLLVPGTLHGIVDEVPNGL